MTKSLPTKSLFLVLFIVLSSSIVKAQDTAMINNKTKILESLKADKAETEKKILAIQPYPPPISITFLIFFISILEKSQNFFK